MPADNTFRLRRGTTSQWLGATSPLRSGEPGYDLSTNTLKIGDGQSLWADLKSVLDITGTGKINGNLYLNNTPVSVSGHTHTASNISNFNEVVSGLLPVKNIIPGYNVNISNSNGDFTISVDQISTNINSTRGSFIMAAPSSIFTIPAGYSVGSLDVFLNGVKLSSALGDYTASNGTSFTLSEPAPSGSIIEYLALTPGSANNINTNDLIIDGGTFTPEV